MRCFVAKAATGRLLTQVTSQLYGIADYQKLTLAWDVLGNLTSRRDESRNENGSWRDVTESFDYDGLNRLTQSQVAGQPAVTQGYDLAGNITSRSNLDGGPGYSYGTGNTPGAGNAGPHAVVQQGIRSYSYDDNGNLTRETVSDSTERDLTWTTFDKPATITRGGIVTSFAYTSDRSHYQRVDDLAGQVTTTLTVGNTEYIQRPTGYEIKRYRPGGWLETKLYASQGGAQTGTTHQLLLTDHLGSTHGIIDMMSPYDTDQSLAWDPWGLRRQTNGSAYPWEQLAFLPLGDPGYTKRGFTGHQRLEETGFIHMGGRLYDPRLGRFIQADPLIQYPGHTQNYNRYSYVHNNPLRYTDPSGYGFDLQDKWDDGGNIVAAAVVSYFTFGAASGAVYGAYGVSASAAAAGCVAPNVVFTASIAGGAAAGAVGGGIMTGSIEGVAQGAFYGAIAGGVAGAMGGGNPYGDFSSVKSTVATVSGYADPRLGPAVRYLLSGSGFGDLAKEGVNYGASVYVDKLANRYGLTTAQLNLALLANSFVGRALVGSAVSEIKGGVRIQGFFSRTLEDGTEAGLWSLPWDINDAILGYQGLADAVSIDYMMNYRGLPLIQSGHSLGALRTNNLGAMGFNIGSPTLRSLPFPNVPHSSAGRAGCGQWDWICGGTFAHVFGSKVDAGLDTGADWWKVFTNHSEIQYINAGY